MRGSPFNVQAVTAGDPNQVVLVNPEVLQQCSLGDELRLVIDSKRAGSGIDIIE